MSRINNDREVEWDDNDICVEKIFGIQIPAPYQELFTWEYRWHDLQYQLAKCGSRKSRATIDRQFYWTLKRKAISKGDKKAELLFPIIYRTVRMCGWIVWNRKGNCL